MCFIPYSINYQDEEEKVVMAHDNDTSSPLAGILITALFGIISIILGAVTMYQVHSIWVRYHHQRKENCDLGAFSLSLSLKPITAMQTLPISFTQTSNSITYPHPYAYLLQPHHHQSPNPLPLPPHPPHSLRWIRHIPSPLIVRKILSAPTRIRYRKGNRTRRLRRV